MCVNFHSLKRSEGPTFFPGDEGFFHFQKIRPSGASPPLVNRPLMINTIRTLRNPGGLKPDQSQKNSWIPLYSEPHIAGLWIWFQLTTPTARGLLVNANSKLQNVKPRTCYSGSCAGRRPVPKGVRDQTPSLIPPVSAYYPNVGTPGTSSGSGTESNVQEERHSVDLDRQGGIVEEDHSDFYEDDDLEEDDDTINGWDEVCPAASIRWHDFRLWTRRGRDSFWMFHRWTEDTFKSMSDASFTWRNQIPVVSVGE